MEYKILLGLAAAGVGIAAYAYYFRGILAGKTKPHVFTWLVWALITSIVFAAQVQKGAGPGAWVTGVTALCTFLVAAIAFKSGYKDIRLLDWFCLAGALLGLGLWITTKDPLSAVVTVTLVDAIAFLPTFRKAYRKPFEENATAFALNSLKFIVGLAALETYALATWLYPASLVLTNGAFALMLLLRRRGWL